MKHEEQVPGEPELPNHAIYFYLWSCSVPVPIWNFHFIIERCCVHIQYYGSVDQITLVHGWQLRSHPHLVTHSHSLGLNQDPLKSQELYFKYTIVVGKDDKVYTPEPSILLLCAIYFF